VEDSSSHCSPLFNNRARSVEPSDDGVGFKSSRKAALEFVLSAPRVESRLLEPLESAGKMWVKLFCLTCWGRLELWLRLELVQDDAKDSEGQAPSEEAKSSIIVGQAIVFVRQDGIRSSSGEIRKRVRCC
jgi:hypothetical protein